jgi:sirohydrochlorin ferrochelatase
MSERERPTLIAAAHGTKDVDGLAELRRLTNIARTSLPGVPVELCFIDVAEPTLVQTLSTVRGPAVIVPLLLSTGQHVKKDIPHAAAGRPDTVISRQIGPDERISKVVQHRLDQARASHAGHPLDKPRLHGHRPEAIRGESRYELDEGDYDRESLPAGPIVLMSAGSTDAQAREQLGEVADHLRQWNSWSVTAAQLTGRDILSGARGETQVASYLLAAGFFYEKLRTQAEGLVLGGPIGAHPLVAQVIVERYLESVPRLGGLLG